MYARNGNYLVFYLVYTNLHATTHITNVIATRHFILESNYNNTALWLNYLNYKSSNGSLHNYANNSFKSHTNTDNFHRQLHKEALEASEFQLHIPPTTDCKVNKIAKFIDDKDENLQVAETDVLKLADRGIIPDFRYPKKTAADTNLLSWHYDRPPDIYIIKFEGVLYLAPKESAIIAYNAAQQLLHKSHEFTVDIPLYFYHLLLHSLPYVSSKRQFVMAAVKYLTILHDKVDQKVLNESIEHLNRVNMSSDPFQPFGIYTGASNKRTKPFMMSITNDVFGTNEFVKQHLDIFKYLDHNDFNYSSIDLLEAYNLQQQKLESLNCWEETFLYRNSIPVSDPTMDRFHQLAFNHAAAQAILHHITVWKMPVYIASNFYTIQELEKRIIAILQYVAHAQDVQASIKYISLHSTAENTINTEISNGEWLSEIVSKVIKGNDIDILPVHVLSDRYNELNATNIANKNIRNLRLYFTDWGHSTYNEKLQTLYSNNVNYFNHTKQLVSLMTLPSTNAGRCWNTGYQLLPPIAEVGKFLESWKRKWSNESDKSTLQDRPPHAIN
ncbi:conserved Plasmodium protein, unknown function [Babesia microti strain RI]|uniref:Uncharacterized protein n=1 Tax=Babesia microti (strain RI) TaxID=1133968 RepID=A0A1R4AAF3_BABMR|nr:conserved Plasmodium protein, unknown function [Babesia microti strain RI]SJK85965.1 conserved Plasmodium protein, unknown function [Babesia microti strain RI]|eukprot:XP_021338168.1 conserved Plasmodium protein, unknown function [Babesia microti strain RI]